MSILLIFLSLLLDSTAVATDATHNQELQRVLSLIICGAILLFWLLYWIRRQQRDDF
ncbi:hypothetical protein [Eisenibacter elegans]|uniref:hypothetical protein n=1 Tax=Eisenibacter elegans TaxID=997 RepID=UPI00041AFC34|nr:hypothetical protein [Eisenibacter elegans]